MSQSDRTVPSDSDRTNRAGPHPAGPGRAIRPPGWIMVHCQAAEPEGNKMISLGAGCQRSLGPGARRRADGGTRSGPGRRET
eukprot:766637-Hanusia_phi.AAC.1